jgi:hypothetical protein
MSLFFKKKCRKNRAISRAAGATLPNGTYGTVALSVTKRHAKNLAFFTTKIN